MDQQVIVPRRTFHAALAFFPRSMRPGPLSIDKLENGTISLSLKSPAVDYSAFFRVGMRIILMEK
jgi:hypothetical protein